jgi:hypothetical protein
MTKATVKPKTELNWQLTEILSQPVFNDGDQPMKPGWVYHRGCARPRRVKGAKSEAVGRYEVFFREISRLPS